MWCIGWLLRQVASVIEERLVADMAERQMAEEKAVEQAHAMAAKTPANRAVKGRAA